MRNTHVERTRPGPIRIACGCCAARTSRQRSRRSHTRSRRPVRTSGACTWNGSAASGGGVSLTGAAPIPYCELPRFLNADYHDIIIGTRTVDGWCVLCRDPNNPALPDDWRLVNIDVQCHPATSQLTSRRPSIPLPSEATSVHAAHRPTSLATWIHRSANRRHCRRNPAFAGSVQHQRDPVHLPAVTDPRRDERRYRVRRRSRSSAHNCCALRPPGPKPKIRQSARVSSPSRYMTAERTFSS